MLRDDEYFTDVTLATEGHSVKAHRVILSACSNYFHAILKVRKDLIIQLLPGHPMVKLNRS